MNYIEAATRGTTSIVIDRWLDGTHTPSPVIRRGIISALENFPPNSLPIILPIIKDIPLPKKPRLRKMTREQRRQVIIEGNDEQLKIMLKRSEERAREKGQIL
jgi:hypothetical protein